VTRYAPNVSILFRELPFLERLRAVVGAGFDVVEMWWPSEADRDGMSLEDFAAYVRGLGLQVVLLNFDAGDMAAGERGFAGDPDRAEYFRKNVPTAVALADSLGCRKLNALAGKRNPGYTLEHQLEALAENVTFAADAAERVGASVMLEPLNPVENPDYLLPSIASALELLNRCGRPNVAVQLDVYHVAMAGEDPLCAIRTAAGSIGHVQFADSPGRHEPGTGTLPFPDLLEALKTHGYQDVIGLEYNQEAQDFAFLTGLGRTAGTDRERLERLQGRLAAEELDALVCVLPENVLLCSGYWAMSDGCAAIVPRVGEPELVVPRGEETWAAESGWRLAVYAAGRLSDPPPSEAFPSLLASRVERLGHSKGTIAVEHDWTSPMPPYMAHEPLALSSPEKSMISRSLGAANLRSGDHLLQRERAVKTSRELTRMRRTAAHADYGLEAFRLGTNAGFTDAALAAHVEAAIEGGPDASTQRVRAYAYVVSGAQTSQAYLPFEVSGRHRPSDGDLIMLELAVVADGYWNDLTRTHVVGEASPLQHKLYAIVAEARAAALDASRAGAQGGDVDQAARRVIEEAGYAQAFPHQTGHGVGHAFHEAHPSLRPGSLDILEQGMIVAIEPGIYLQGLGGIRIEDDCVIGTADSATPLAATKPVLVPFQPA
jgi:hydroxypyruvate isomerase